MRIVDIVREIPRRDQNLHSALCELVKDLTACIPPAFKKSFLTLPAVTDYLHTLVWEYYQMMERRLTSAQHTIWTNADVWGTIRRRTEIHPLMENLAPTQNQAFEDWGHRLGQLIAKRTKHDFLNIWLGN
jgi:hypothetical protein